MRENRDERGWESKGYGVGGGGPMEGAALANPSRHAVEEALGKTGMEVSRERRGTNGNGFCFFAAEIIINLSEIIFLPPVSIS